MAKKKNAPVLRGQSEGGEEPATTTITKSYAVRDKWLDKAKDNLVEFKSVDGEVQDLLVNGEPAGGGGGSTATVSITNSSAEAAFELIIPHINGDTQQSEGGSVVVPPGETSTVTVLLGPSGCYALFGGRGDVPSSGTATGGITYEAGDVYITGNGTLTVS